MITTSKLVRYLRSVKRDESGVLAVEAILIFPMLLWAIAATFIFFEGFRQSAANLKAASTVGDLISRETQTVTNNYIDSLHELMEAMVNNGSDVDMRVSLIVYDEADDRHYVRWSAVRGFEVNLSNDTIEDLRANLPPMPDQDTLILVETSNNYVPVFDIRLFSPEGLLSGITFENFIIARPRFTNEIAAAV